MSSIDLSRSLKLASRDFAARKFDYYRAMLEEPRVYRGHISVVKLKLLASYDECLALLKDPRFIRNRSTVTGGSRFPIPMPKTVQLLAASMIQEDGGAHQRLRNLVNRAFTPHAIAALGDRVEDLSQEVLDHLHEGDRVDLIDAYTSQIPTAVIGEMMGLHQEDMPTFRNSLKVLTKGLSGWNLLRTFAFDLRRTSSFVRALIERKKAEPGDDILTGLIEAEEAGDRLSEDELVAMVFLLVIAGYETTTHLIANGVVALLAHPEQLERFRKDPEIQGPAVEEILRYTGPIHGTKPNWAIEDVHDFGEPIRKGEAVMPMLGAANRDPRAFQNPDVFDIGRSPNHHLAFSHGPHFCLGSHLARMETRIALRDLFDRFPGLKLDVPENELEYATMPGWNRFRQLPVVLGS